MSQELFSSFASSNKAQWLQKVEKDLKGKSIDELNWQLEENITLSPFYTREDQSETNPSLTLNKSSNTWQIGEYIDVDNLEQANKDVLKALNGGVNAPLFRFHHLPSTQAFEQLLKGVESSYISVHFEPQDAGKDPAEFFRNLIYYARKTGVAIADTKGSLDFDPLLDWDQPPFKALARILAFAGRQTPHFKVLHINGQVFHTGVENTSVELALILSKATEYLDQMEKQGIAPSLTNKHLQFSVSIGNSYFVEIAKLRALRILWANILDAYQIEDELPPVVAHIALDETSTDVPTNMIKASTQTMSAAIGGANTIFVPPADYKQSDRKPDFTSRIARNVQHLLQLESGLDRVIDPASGSYYIETLTKALCEGAWKHFKAIENKGGFLKVDKLEL